MCLLILLSVPGSVMYAAETRHKIQNTKEIRKYKTVEKLLTLKSALKIQGIKSPFSAALHVLPAV